MGLFDKLRKSEPAAPPATGPVSKRGPAKGIVCKCGQSFSSEEKHHRHLHEAHPEHHH